MSTHSNSIDHIIHQLKHYLPSQAPIKDFIHHNSLHAFQDEPFYTGIFRASAIFGSQVVLPLEDYRQMYRNGRISRDILLRVITQHKGQEQQQQWLHKVTQEEIICPQQNRIGKLRAIWQAKAHVDMDLAVHPLLFRLLGAYLDQGISLIPFPQSSTGFWDAVVQLETNSSVSLFQTDYARELLLEGKCTIEDLLQQLIGDAAYWEAYLFDQQFAHRGWSGMVAVVEDRPETLTSKRTISLHDLIRVELLFELDVLMQDKGRDIKPLSHWVDFSPYDLFAPTPLTSYHEVMTIWQDAFEWSYYDRVLAGIDQLNRLSSPSPAQWKLQAVFCIDERECSFRRYLEIVEPEAQTFGMPGFFGVEFFFRPQNASQLDKLCPAPVTPRFLIREYQSPEKKLHDTLYSNKTQTLFGGYWYSLVYGFWAVVRLFTKAWNPKETPAVTSSFEHMNPLGKLTVECANPPEFENNLQVGFSVDEMTDRVEQVLRGIGLTADFAPLVYFVAHGSSSANNPFYGAYDCGACSGRPGSVNARVIANMANHPEVRKKLTQRGIQIPDSTHVIGALHDTSSDKIMFYDIASLDEEHVRMHEQYVFRFEEALDYNARERSRRFASIATDQPIKKIRTEVAKRARAMFEPRPELGHGTNALCIIGDRRMTRGLFLDRRAFLNSYDYQNDPDGKRLAGIIRPIAPVCGGINLEYYFSRVDNSRLGAGTKLPHNVMGLIGVANSSDGDLRPGLPLQMIEVHDPVRLLVIVQQTPEVLLQVLQADAAVWPWYEKEWVHIMAFHPQEKRFYRLRQGQFEPYTILHPGVSATTQLDTYLKQTKTAKTGHVVESTKENLPVMIIDQKNSSHE